MSYGDAGALAACLVFHRWDDAREARALTARIRDVAPYEPGSFYKRELPCLLEVLGLVGAPLDAVIVDGYVWLSRDGRPGLGARLFEALGQRTAVVGVAKTSFAGADFAAAVTRGTSAKPLYVTAAGMDVAEAVDRVRSMAGAYRIPELLKRVDRLCRGG